MLEAAVVAWPDEDELIKPKAFVVLKSAGQGLRRACARAAGALSRATLAPYKYPRWIEFRTDLPKTATGKIQRFKLRAESAMPCLVVFRSCRVRLDRRRHDCASH